MPEPTIEHFFKTRAEASTAAADFIGNTLKARLQTGAEASLVVSGGSSPIDCFNHLSEVDLDWSDVRILLSDERWVPAKDNNSNENLVRTQLLQNNASTAHLLPVYDDQIDIGLRCEAIDLALQELELPFAASLLGMGEDGHFASLFPDAENLASGLSLDNRQLCIPVITAASPYPRVSLTLTALSNSDNIVLLLFGKKKRDVYEAAKSAHCTYPLAALLSQNRAPIQVYWAP
ncbi:MAG TPA: 6-phosphogluconolactonase [Arenicellales bacterium]|jgi:6-phosphogluconolactonase|nr:6-phosphogluconolactonase [Arenicellales bacterium]HJL66299.1 6-phosphogluconolactonase [Arenicellales bacterium]|tara:strand:+ start:5694 stop:6392 length:699 start_codon:yes stop_codon:yes gene_type:complete